MLWWITHHPGLLPRHRGPIPLVVLQTRLTDPGHGARRVECGDGPIWGVASKPA
jgi:hypothetical protein